VPIPGAKLTTDTTIVGGRASAALDALLQEHRSGRPACVVYRHDLPDGAALDLLAAGLCHVTTLALPLGDALDAAAGELATRLGPITTLEVARSAARVDSLIVPAAAYDSPPIVRLRNTLRSGSFRRIVRDLPGWSGRTSGRETWYFPPGHPGCEVVPERSRRVRPPVVSDVPSEARVELNP
jgi:hypothetical protein